MVKLLGNKLGFNLIKSKLQGSSKPKGEMDLVDVDHGFFLVKFDMSDDRGRMVKVGPWMIFDHYLAVLEWSNMF